MLTFILDTIGNWNPQLLRELKSHLKPIKIGLAIAFAIIFQLVFLMIVWGLLPGGIEPNHLSVTTYPQIQVDYSSAGPLSIEYLRYDYPLEKHPNYDISASGLEQYSRAVKVGDRILAINGQPLNWDETGTDNTLSKQEVYETIVKQPFAAAIQQIKSLPTSEIAAQTLRQEVPGTTVVLTLSREENSEPFEVTLPRIVESTITSSYCLPLENWHTMVPAGERRYSSCSGQLDDQQYEIDWTQWHRDAFWGLNIATLFPLLILGTYTLINNLLREEREGTLNFIRLSPQSAGEILLGKMLGVPALVYLVVALTLPLNLFHGVSAGLGWGVIAGFYGATVAIAFLTFSAALLIGMVNMSLGMVQAWLGSGGVFLVQLLCLQTSRHARADDTALGWALMFSPFSMLRGVNEQPFMDSYSVTESLFRWFGIPMVSIVLFVLLLAHTIVLGRWVWHALERRFFNPTSTLLSKAQSYGLTLAVNIAAIGFSWSPWVNPGDGLRSADSEISSYTPPSFWVEHHFLFLLVINLSLWVIMIVALSPQRQNLHDWARYRHLLPAPVSQPGQKSWGKFPRRSFWSDLIWGEKSPIVVAIALNLFIGAVCIFLWMAHQAFLSVGDLGMLAMAIIVAFQNADSFNLITLAFIVLLATTNILLICTTIAQLIFLKREKHALPTAILTFMVLLSGIPITLVITAIEPHIYPSVWFALFPWTSVFEPLTSVTAGILGLFGQWTVLGLLNWWVFHWLERIGTSASKELLTGTKELA